MALSPTIRKTPSCQIRQVTTAVDRDLFLQLPWRIYRDDPQWVPPLLWERKQFIDPRKHPFYLHGAAALFLAQRGGEVVGRIMASDDPHYNQEHGTNLGCFGLFESINDPEVAHGLLDTAAQWLRGRGRTHVMGPIDYSTNYPCGLLVDGFDTPPRVMMNHHPRYYAPLLESWGLAKAKDQWCWWFDGQDNNIASWKPRLARMAKRSKVVVRSFRKSHFNEDVKRSQNVYNEAWETNWGFVRMTDAEFSSLANELKHLADPDLLLLAEVDGQPVGFSMTLPDFNEAIGPLNGRLFRWGLPIGLLKFLWLRKKIKTGRLLILGVKKGYRGRGIAEMLIVRTFDIGMGEVGLTGAELGWTLEDNDMINRPIAAVGGRHYKTYRIYEKTLDSAATG